VLHGARRNRGVRQARTGASGGARTADKAASGTRSGAGHGIARLLGTRRNLLVLEFETTRRTGSYASLPATYAGGNAGGPGEPGRRRRAASSPVALIAPAGVWGPAAGLPCECPRAILEGGNHAPPRIAPCNGTHSPLSIVLRATAIFWHGVPMGHARTRAEGRLRGPLPVHSPKAAEKVPHGWRPGFRGSDEHHQHGSDVGQHDVRLVAKAPGRPDPRACAPPVRGSTPARPTS